ncbi:MAG: glycoside hydrolase family 108 protein [Bacillota bacterium]
MQIKDRFKKIIKKVIDYEGGYSNDKDDRGGKTKFGITERLARTYNYQGKMKNLTLNQACEIYYQEFWIKNLYGWFEDEDIIFEVLEQAVNLGADRANRHLQEGYNLLVKDKAEIKVDGIIGSQTINAINNLEYKNELLKILNLLQGQKYIDIIKNNSSQKKFIRGWLKRVKIN